MRVFHHIIIGLSALGFASQSMAAQPLSRAEQQVCASLRMCVDLVKRHDASEFDYDVLTQEFRRFGPQGRAVLFDILESDAGTADVASIIAALGSRRVEDQARIDRMWALDKAEVFLPLLGDGSLPSRNMLLATLGHKDANVREQARLLLIPISDIVKRQPLPSLLRPTLLDAMARDPMSVAADYIGLMPIKGLKNKFSELLSSEDRYIVTAAYAALYRDNPSTAFNVLLDTIRNIDSQAQARAIGDMLAHRHKGRADGFYAKFTADLSQDPNLKPLSRAVGLQARFKINAQDRSSFMDMNQARLEALDALIISSPFQVQDQYLPVLSAQKSQAALSHVWTIAQSERWINRGQLAKYYLDTPMNKQVVRDLLRTNDFRSFRAGLELSKKFDQSFDGDIRAQIDHPVLAISYAAGRRLGLKNQANNSSKICKTPEFDLDDMSSQMPFFDSVWMRDENNGRTRPDRRNLTTAHPLKDGWLAGYVLDNRSSSGGGTLVAFDNQTGDFEAVGNFSAPFAILPDRPLRIGQTTSRFWIVDDWGGDSFDTSVYRLTLSPSGPSIEHISLLPVGSDRFGLTSQGDLLLSFSTVEGLPAQPPLRLSPNGNISRACLSSGQSMPAPSGI